MLFSTSMKALLAFSLFIGPSFQHETRPFSNTAGFSNPTFSTSSGGFANCLSGHVKVPATTTANDKLLFHEPLDQYAVTASFVHFIQANSSQAAEVNSGPATVSETFNIQAKLCFPKNAYPVSTIQFLIHGIGFNQSYWDFAEGYSFIDVAAKAGYPTFSCDRLGVGASDHPEPIQIVQAPLQVEICTYHHHSLTPREACRTEVQGYGRRWTFLWLDSICRSPSEIPRRFRRLVLTGFSTDTSALGITFADFNSAIAAQNQPHKFKGLPNGYLVVDNAIANQFAFFYYPSFDVNSE